VDGNYELQWTLISTAEDENGNLIENPGCPITYIPAITPIIDCTTLDFDGLDDVAVINNDFSGVKSIEAWIRPEISGGTVIAGPTFEITTPTGLEYNTRWYHLAVVFSGSGQGLYLDGIWVTDAPPYLSA